MTAFGASVVLLFSAANARRRLTDGAREETRRARWCDADVPCEVCRRRRIERCGPSDAFKVDRVCFRD